MPDTKGIGCGIYPVLLTNTRFVAACEWHDNAYTEKSWAEANLTRKQVDKWFLDQMLTIAGGNWWHRARARLFYGIARLAGNLWWEGK